MTSTAGTQATGTSSPGMSTTGGFSRAVPEQPVVDAQNPWPGLTAFSEELSGFFYGRVDETEELLRRVRRNTLTVLFGKSGLGKTSLLQAGLSPRLRAEHMVPVSIRIDYSPDAPPPTDQINAAVAAALAPVARAGTPLPKVGDSLWEYFHRRDVTLADPSGQQLTPVLIVDQFEELFTIGPTSDTGRARNRALVTALAELIENRPPDAFEQRLETNPDLVDNYEFDGRHYSILLSLREDYLANLQSFRSEIPSVGQNGMRLTGMNGRQALAAVVEPGRDLVTPAVARHIVQNVAGAARAAGDSTDPTDLASLEVEPSLLSLVCRELNNRRLAAHLPQISAELLADSRDAILRKFYDDALADQPEGVRQFVEDELLNESGFRESVSLEKARKTIVARGGVPDALDQLVRRRLLHVEERLGAQRVEITHDVLTKIIAQSRAERQEREAAVAAAERERQLNEQVRKGRRRTQLTAVGLGSLMLLAIGVAVVIFRDKQGLDRQTGLVTEYVSGVSDKLWEDRSEEFNTIYGHWLEKTNSFVGQWTAAYPGSSSAATLQAVLMANEAEAKQRLAAGQGDSAAVHRFEREAKAKADTAFSMSLVVAKRWRDAKSRKQAAIAVGTTALTWKALEENDTALATIDTGIALARSVNRAADSSADAFEAIFHRIRSDILIARAKPGDSSQALQSLTTAARLLSPLPPPYAGRIARDELGFTFESLGWLQAHFGLLSQAKASYDSAIRARRSLIDSLSKAGAAARETLNEQQRRLAGTYLDLTYLYKRQGDTTAALAAYDASRQLSGPRARSSNAPFRYKKTFARGLIGVANIELARSRTPRDSARVVPKLDTIITLTRAVYESSDDPDDWDDLARAFYQLAQVQLSNGDHKGALLNYQNRATVLHRIYTRRKTVADRYAYASALGGLAYIHVLNGQADSALASADLGLVYDSTQTFIWSNVIDAYLLKHDWNRADATLRTYACANLGDKQHYTSFVQTMLDDDMKQFQRYGLVNAEVRRFEGLARSLAPTCTRR